MAKFINMYTGTVMEVADERVQEYKEAGHKLMVPKPKPAVVKVAEPEKKTVRKRATKK